MSKETGGAQPPVAARHRYFFACDNIQFKYNSNSIQTHLIPQTIIYTQKLQTAFIEGGQDLSFQIACIV
jgi:hypothetical protein